MNMRLTAVLTVGCMVPLVCFATGAAAAEPARIAQAVKNQDMTTARSLIKQKADVNTALPDGSTALHWAAQWDDVETTDLLLAAGATVDAVDASGVAPLSLACTNGNAVMIEKLLKAGAKIDAALPTGETPLMTAARTGRVDAVKMLIDHGADLKAVETASGQTALMWAAAEGHADVVRLLIARGADAHAKSKGGFTSLLFAAQTGSREVTRALLDAGVNINEPGGNGTTALVVATINRHTGFAQHLLELGADPNKGPGYTAAHVAALQEGHDISNDGGPEKVAFIKLLLERGSDPNGRATRAPRGVGSTGATPFFLAAWAGDADVMKVLLEKGADPMIPTTLGTTALMAAAGILHSAGGENTPEQHALEAVKLCLELGLDVNAANTSHNDTALHGAAFRGLEGGAAIAQLLIDHGAKLDIVDKRGWTPLAIAEGLYFSAGNTKDEKTTAVLRKAGAAPTSPTLERNAGVRSGEVWYEPGREPATLGPARAGGPR
jgi:ankyrin repeat protein